MKRVLCILLAIFLLLGLVALAAASSDGITADVCMSARSISTADGAITIDYINAITGARYDFFQALPRFSAIFTDANGRTICLHFQQGLRGSYMDLWEGELARPISLTHFPQPVGYEIVRIAKSSDGPGIPSFSGDTFRGYLPVIAFRIYIRPYDSDITVLLNGNPMGFDVAPRIMNGRTLVPMRAIFETLGAEITWIHETQTVIGRRGADTITLTIGSTEARVNDRVLQLDVAPVIVGGRTLVPIRFIAESLGANVGWHGRSQTVLIDSSPSAPIRPDSGVFVSNEQELRDALGRASVVILTQDIEVNGGISIRGSRTLKGNHTITFVGSSSMGFSVSGTNVHFILDGPTVRSGDGTYITSLVTVHRPNTFTMRSGQLSLTHSGPGSSGFVASHAAVLLSANGSGGESRFIMEGGTIIGNSAAWPSQVPGRSHYGHVLGVNVSRGRDGGGAFTMTGGTIFAGGVTVAPGWSNSGHTPAVTVFGDFTMTGGTIISNGGFGVSLIRSGGASPPDSPNFNMSGGTIIGNEIGVNITGNDANFQMKGGVIAENGVGVMMGRRFLQPNDFRGPPLFEVRGNAHIRGGTITRNDIGIGVGDDVVAGSIIIGGGNVSGNNTNIRNDSTVAIR